ncbi:MAG: hypothetical protein R3211_05455 [Balneolaceae bacterium]|nr:hypothetical protein [Balneolaceae bacterium]
MRSHSARFIAVGVVWIGLILSMAQPLKAGNSSRAFVHWLSSYLADTDSQLAREHIIHLNDSNADLPELIAEASKIINDHNGEFNFPFETEDPSTDQLIHLLVLGWNQFQDGNSMGKAVSVHPVKTIFAKTVERDALHTPAAVDIDNSGEDLFVCADNAGQQGIADHILTPMVSGIAIGAP